MSITALLLLCVLLVGVWQFWLLQGSLDRQRKLVTIAVSQRDSLLEMVNEETGVRGLVATKDPRFLQIYYQSLPQQIGDEKVITASLDVLPKLQPAARTSRALALKLQQYFTKEIHLARTGNVLAARAGLAEGRRLFDGFRSADAVVEGQADNQLDAQRSHTVLLARAGLVVGLVVSGALILGAIGFLALLQRARRYRLNSMRDSLTGAVNRRGAMSAIEDLIDESRPQPFGLVFIDLDGARMDAQRPGRKRSVGCSAKENGARRIARPPVLGENARHMSPRIGMLEV